MRILFLVWILILPFFSFSQIELGAKAGLNFLEKPDIDISQTSLTEVYQTAESGNTGYHVGLFLKAKLVGIYIRPELIYTHFKTEFLDANGSEFYVKTNRLDVPVLVGKQFLKILYLHAGPVASFYFDNQNDLQGLNQSDEDSFSFGLQVGGGVSISKFSIGIRWEEAISNNIIKFITGDSNYEIRSNPSQFLVSVGYTF